jgi:spore maturation protein CgeB
MVSQLRTAGLKILTVGRGWEAHPDDGGFAVGDALVRAYNVAKFSLDITTKSTSLSSRLFQAASCGTPSITIDREDVRGLFLPGEEILLYSDPDASTELIRSYVELANYRELGDMAKRRAIADHTADSRVDAILDAISRMEPKPTQ